MALFGRKKKDTTKEAAIAAATVVPAKASKKETKAPTPSTKRGVDAGAILLRPRMTEKAAILSESGVYVFDVKPEATKAEVSAAVAKVFNVHPVTVRMVTVVAKTVVTRGTGTSGRKSGGKKAYVKLKEGEKIELI